MWLFLTDWLKSVVIDIGVILIQCDSVESRLKYLNINKNRKEKTLSQRAKI
jgi:hypothetical protein